MEKINNTPVNTSQIFDMKMLELTKYCRTLYGNSESSVFIAAENLFIFMYYQSYKEKKNKRSTGKFNIAEFDRVMDMGYTSLMSDTA